ncbi:MAG TPA: DUF2203 family protein [Candidatus Handelsmanbacteria bacterium]|nr:DUF2203 family protein [Candidatus Handelsmanbacteria bacterium]
MGHHAFTVDEANEMIPGVRATLNEIQGLRDGARSTVDQLAVLDALWGDLVSQEDNPDHEEYVQHRQSLSECRRAIEELIQGRIVDRGIRFPVGGLEHGLVDFPTTPLGSDSVFREHVIRPESMFVCFAPDRQATPVPSRSSVPRHHKRLPPVRVIQHMPHHSLAGNSWNPPVVTYPVAALSLVFAKRLIRSGDTLAVRGQNKC